MVLDGREVDQAAHVEHEGEARVGLREGEDVADLGVRQAQVALDVLVSRPSPELRETT